MAPKPLARPAGPRDRGASSPPRWARLSRGALVSQWPAPPPVRQACPSAWVLAAPLDGQRGDHFLPLNTPEHPQMVQGTKPPKPLSRPPVPWAAAASERSGFFVSESCSHGLTFQHAEPICPNCPRVLKAVTALEETLVTVTWIFGCSGDRSLVIAHPKGRHLQNALLFLSTPHLSSPVSCRSCT